LLSPYIDNFTLIDKAACITTVTGTVAGESLFRGTPVLVFGNATCRDNKYVFRINNDLDIKYALSQIENISKDDVRTYMHKEYVSQVLRKSFAGYDKLEDINLPEYGRTRFAKANCKVLSAILIGKVAVN
jgi:ribosomal protein S8